MEKIALVTGGATGIGSAICHRLAENGIQVISCYNKSEIAARKLAELKFSSGGRIFPEKLNLSDAFMLKRGLSEIQRKYEKIQILVNNAGIAQPRDFLEITEQDYESMLFTNLQAPFLLTQDLIPTMVSECWGRIVNVASIGGQWGGTRQIHYAVSKSGLIGLTRSLAKTFGNSGITCNAVSPGQIDSEMLKKEMTIEEYDAHASSIPMRRIGSPQDVAAAVSFLVSDEASYITGQTLNVNGGLYFG